MQERVPLHSGQTLRPLPLSPRAPDAFGFNAEHTQVRDDTEITEKQERDRGIAVKSL